MHGQQNIKNIHSCFILSPNATSSTLPNLNKVSPLHCILYSCVHKTVTRLGLFNDAILTA